MNLKETARNKHKNGNNCAVAVYFTFYNKISGIAHAPRKMKVENAERFFLRKRCCLSSATAQQNYPKGNTKALIDAFTKGAQGAGHEVVECPVGAMNIKGRLGVDFIT